MTKLNKSAGKGWFWIALEQFGQRGMLLIVGMIQARLMSPEDFGLVASISIFLFLAQSLIDSGIGQCIVQKKDLSERDYTALFWSNLCMSLVMFTLLFVFAGAIAKFLHQPRLTSIVRCFAGVVLLMNAGRVQYAMLTRNLKFKTISLISTGANLAGCIVGVTLALLNFGVWALVWQQLTVSGAKAMIYWALMPWRPKEELRWDAVKGLYAFGLPLLGAQVVQGVAGQIINVLIARKFNATALGYYDRGKLIPGSLGMAFCAIFPRVNFPILSSLQNEEEAYKKCYRHFLIIASTVVFIIMAAIGTMSEQIIEIVLGHRWLEAAPYFKLSCIVFAVYIVHVINQDVLRSMGFTGLYFKYNTLFSCVQIAFIVIGMRWGIIGMILGDIVGRMCGLLAIMHCVHRQTCINFFWQVKSLLIPMFVAGGLIGLLKIISIHVDNFWLRFLLSGICAACVLGLSVFSIYFSDRKHQTRGLRLGAAK